MLTGRAVIVAFGTCVATALAMGTLAAVSAAPPVATAPHVLPSTVFDLSQISGNKTEVGEYRQLVRSPTATLDELELHVTTLNPGLSSHPPHRHPNEELVIIKEGTLEAFVDGKTVRVGPGAVIFNASNQLHGIKNVGSVPAVYHVINWRAPGQQAP